MKNNLNLRICTNCKGETAVTIYIPPKGSKIAEAVCKECNITIVHRVRSDAESKENNRHLLLGIAEAIITSVDEQNGGNADG